MPNHRSWLLALAIVGWGSIALAQQQPAQPAPLVVHALKAGSVYWIEGAGSNTGVIIGQTGVVIIDPKMTADSGREIIAEVSKLTNKPITHVIETHSDIDHTNGLLGFPDGLTIIAHENNKKEQEQVQGARRLPPNRLPNQLVTRGDETMRLNGVNVRLLHWGPAHTSGDLVIYLPDDRILFGGDVIMTVMPDLTTPLLEPLLHPNKGGTSEGWVKTVVGIAGLNAETIVTGHGNVTTMAEVRARLKRAEDKRARIEAMVKEGKSLEEIKRVVDIPLPNPAPTPLPGGRGIPPNFPMFTEYVYEELTKKS